MEYRENWDKSKKRFEAFWQGEIIDRCCMSVFAPKSQAYANETMPENLEDKVRYWTDGEWIVKRNRALFESTYFAGDAFPNIFLNLGATCHAGYFKNAKYEFRESVWYYPSLEDYDDLEFDEQSFLYQKTLELANYISGEGKDSFYVSMQDTAGNADALAGLRGSQRLLMDFLEKEDEVKHALDKLQQVWEKTNTDVYDILEKNGQYGTTIGWLHTWAPGRHAQMQCDLSVMISPPAFDRYIFPEIKNQSKWLEYPLYHFDGMEQRRHLDKLLSIKELKAIQWTCVEGQPPVLEFIPALKKIQEAGKGIVILVKPGEVEPLLEQISAKGLYLVTWVSSKEEADSIIKLANKLSR